MERLFTFWSNYVTVSLTARTFLEKHATINTYPAGDYFMRPGERRPYWCLVLEGLACGYTFDETGKQHIHWFTQPYQGFTGTRHLYTPHQEKGISIQFLRHTVVLRMNALRMREAKEQFPEVSELIHVLKQRFINRLNRLIRILQIMDGTERVASFRKEFPLLYTSLNPEQLAAHLNLSVASIYRILQHLRASQL